MRNLLVFVLSRFHARNHIRPRIKSGQAFGSGPQGTPGLKTHDAGEITDDL
jgi:hypothetical protein